MSIKLMSLVWEKALSHSEQSILLAMADYADDDGRNCYPSYERLAWKTGYSTRQVTRIIKELCASGILVILRPSTQHQSTHYWIRLDKAVNKEPFSIDKVSSLTDSSIDKMSSQEIQGRHLEHPGWTSATSRVDMVSTDPLVNHHIEPSVTTSLPSAKPPKKSKPVAEIVPATPTPQQEMFAAVCESVGWDYKTITDKDKGQVAQTVGVLIKADYTVDDIRRFITEIWFKDWRWQKNQQYPTLSQLRQDIGKLRSVVPSVAPPAKSTNNGVNAVLEYKAARERMNGR